MGECGVRGGYSEIINMDPDVKALYIKSISAKCCPTSKKNVNNFGLQAHNYVILFFYLKFSSWPGK